MFLGAVFEFGVIATNIATAVVLYPIAKRYTQTGAIAYVAARLVECTFILVGLVSLLTIVTLQQDVGGSAGEGLLTTTTALTATYDWAFLWGPGLMAGVGNGLILGYVMYRSGLIPRRLAMLGPIAGSVHIIGFLGVLFGAFEAASPPQLGFTALEMCWEAAVPMYCIAKGFLPTGRMSLDEIGPTAEPSLITATT